MHAFCQRPHHDRRHRPQLYEVVAHAQTGVLLGAQLMCEHATDMIGQLSQAIANGMTARQLLAAMRPHPTFEEALGEALEELVAKLPE